MNLRFQLYRYENRTVLYLEHDEFSHVVIRIDDCPETCMVLTKYHDKVYQKEFSLEPKDLEFGIISELDISNHEQHIKSLSYNL